jgi:glucose-1-phosphate adenylyltransferase
MKTIALIMAGGASENLSVLTAVRAEPAIPFGGKYRIIDFPLSNCVNSGIYNVALLTQYMPRSLNDHVGVGKPWDLDRTQGGLRLLQPYLGPNQSGWQRGTADAVRSNMDFLLEQKTDAVLVLAGDHIYKMDYSLMLRSHEQTKADVTLGVRRVSPFETYRFGIVSTDPGDMRITGFKEKPRRSKETLASMGIYIFKTEVLAEILQDENMVDFGRDVLPQIIKTRKVYSYGFEGYWADVGTLQAYWEANMALLAETPALDLYDPEWVIHTRSEEQPPVAIGPNGWAGGNLISNGCVIEGVVERSVLSPGVRVAPGAIVRDSVVMNDTYIGPNARVERAIVDKHVYVGEGAEVGYGVDNIPNKLHPGRLNTGLTAIGKRVRVPNGIKIGHNVILSPHIGEKELNTDYVASGETI